MNTKVKLFPATNTASEETNPQIFRREQGKLGNKQVKVLFVSPFAHCTGYYSWISVYETQALARAGAEITLLTFCGVRDEAKVKVNQATVGQYIKLALPIYHLAKFFRNWNLTARLSYFIEMYLTLSVAIRLKRKLKFDIIHLSDCEPFPFLVHLFNMRLKHYKWVISLNGINLIKYPPLFEALREDPIAFIKIIAMKIINSNLWKPAYHRSFARNRFIFITMDESMKQRFEAYLDGVLSGKVICLPWGIDKAEKTISQEEARRHFQLPLNNTLLLSFGLFHVGKDLDTVFNSLKDVPDAILIHGGDSGLNNKSNDVASLAQRYGIKDRVIIRNYYIPEEEKPYYFLAADAIILSYKSDWPDRASLLWEACRFRTPVIASDNVQLKQLVETFHLGLVFKAQDASSLTETIIKFTCLEPREIQTLKNNCDKFCDEFSRNKWAKECLDIYKELY